MSENQEESLDIAKKVKEIISCCAAKPNKQHYLYF